MRFPSLLKSIVFKAVVGFAICDFPVTVSKDTNHLQDALTRFKQKGNFAQIWSMHGELLSSEDFISISQNCIFNFFKIKLLIVNFLCSVTDIKGKIPLPIKRSFVLPVYLTHHQGM